MQSFIIEAYSSVEDIIGGIIENWNTLVTVEGYIDLLDGSDLPVVQNAITENSTHILIIPKYTDGITDDMRVVGEDGRYYTITYSDNPVGQNHHNEIYLKYGGVL